MAKSENLDFKKYAIVIFRGFTGIPYGPISLENYDNKYKYYFEFACNPKVFESLITNLDCENINIKLQSIKSIGMLLYKYEMSSPFNYSKILNLLIKNRNKVKEPLKKLLNNINQNIRYEAANALAKIKAKECIQTLIHFARYGSLNQKKEDIYFLGELKAKEACETIIEQLENDKQEIRLQSIIALGKIGTNEAINAIIILVDDKDLRKEHLFEIIDVIGDIGKNEGYEKIIGILSKLFLKKNENIWINIMTNYSKFIKGKDWKEIFQNLHKIDKQNITDALLQHLKSEEDDIKVLASEYIIDFGIDLNTLS